MLPNKLSDLITVALADLTQIEAMPETYTVDMTTYHRPENGVCHVCLAGAVIARTLDRAPTEHVWTSKTGYQDHLQALNAARQGYVYPALRQLGQPTKFPSYVPITPYATNPADFRADMIALAANLATEGL